MSTDEAHVLIITGAGGGLGGAMARGLLAAGRRIVAVDIEAGAKGLAALTADAAAAGAAERLLTTTANVRSEDEADAVVARTLERFGTVQGLINNAGLGPYRQPGDTAFTFLDVPPGYWQALIDTNVNGPFMMTRAVVPELLAAGWGRVINVTTSLATMVMKGMAPYGAAKAALEAASAIWAKDLDGSGVTVNVLVPGGAADTGMVPNEAEPDRSKLISPQVMVAPAVWLTSRASDGTTAHRIVAKDWKPGGPIEQNLRENMAPVAWQG
jgi:NAD(P)-dependent dehydrogenase (short-subunit alcohol dehydrogenase family)